MMARRLVFLVLTVAWFSCQGLMLQAYAGPVGAGLGQAGFGEQVQNAGDALANSLMAAATKGKGVRGASGVLGELAYNSGNLICSAWIISFNIQIRKMIMESLRMEGAELNQQLQLIRQAQDFMAKLAKACEDQGFMGTTGTPAGAPAGTPATGAGTAAGGTAAEPATPGGRITPRPGETVADAICRQKCEDLYRKMLEEQRELERIQRTFDRVKAEADKDQQDLKQMEADLAQAQQAKEAATKTLRTPHTGSLSDAQVKELQDANTALQAAERRINDLNSKLPQQRQKAAKSAQDLATWERILQRQIAETEAAVAAYNKCIKDCIKAAQAAGERTTIRISSSQCSFLGAPQNCAYDAAPGFDVAFASVPLTFDSRVCVNYGGGTTSIPIGPGGIGIPAGPVSGPVSTPPIGFNPPPTPPAAQGGTPITPGETLGTTPPIGPVTPLQPGDIDPGQIPPIPADFFNPSSDPFFGTYTRFNPDGTPIRSTVDTPTIPIQVTELGLTSTTPVTVATPQDLEVPPAETIVPPTIPPEAPRVVLAAPVMIVKAEQSVLEGDKTVTKPVQGAVLKLGYPPPPLPGTTTRTAEATDDQHDAEPRHVVTNADGIGVIFTTDAWPAKWKPWVSQDPETPSGAPPALEPELQEGTMGDRPDIGGGPEPSSSVPATGLKLDLTPTKSSIVYVGPGDDPFGGTPVQPQGDTQETSALKAAGTSGVPGITSGWGEEGGALAAVGQLPETVQPYIIDAVSFGGMWGLTLNYPASLESQIQNDLEGFEVEENHYRDKQQVGDGRWTLCPHVSPENGKTGK